MKSTCLTLLVVFTSTAADIGEKLRLGLDVKSIPQRNYNLGLQAPASDNKPAATSYTDDEDNLERLCNDAFHSFLCKTVGPRKTRIDGMLRPGAKVPASLLSGSATNLDESRQAPLQKSGGGLLATGIQPFPGQGSQGRGGLSNNFYLPPGNQPSPTQQFVESKPGPSNQYLPSLPDPVPIPQDNLQLLVPIQQPQQIVYQYTAPPLLPTTNFIIHSPAPQQTQFFSTGTPAPPRLPAVQSTTRQPIITTVTPAPTPSNRYLPIVEPIDIRISPDSTNILPQRQGGGLLAVGRTESPKEEKQPRKEERHHTLEELCNDAFHSFLCKPITTPRKRIDGRIRPGAKIPPHVLQSLGNPAFTRAKVPPQQSGSALLAFGRQEENVPQQQYYAFQASNQQPVQDFGVSSQRGTPGKVPERIPPPKYQPTVNQLITQNTKPQIAPLFKFQTTPQAQSSSFFTSNNLLTDSVVSTVSTARPLNIVPTHFCSYHSLSAERPIQYYTAQSANVALANQNQPASDGYQYSTPRFPLSFPLTTQRPIITQNPLYIPTDNQKDTNLIAFQNQIVTSTERPVTTFRPIDTTGYSYPKPSSKFTLPPFSSTTNQVTTSRPSISADGYTYPKPAQVFTLPTSTVRPINEGYTYRRPIVPFTLPSSLTNGATSQLQLLANTITPIQTINNAISNYPMGDEQPLAPASQFEILKL